MFGIVVVELDDIVGIGNHCGKVDKNNFVVFFSHRIQGFFLGLTCTF